MRGTGRKEGSENRVRRLILGKRPARWLAPVAILAVFAMVATSAAMAVAPLRFSHDEWSAINLNFGANPLSQQLEIKFARVSYIDQPTQFNTTGFTGATLTGNGSFLVNTSGYGVAQYNSTTGDNALASFPIGAYLGANVSYAFSDQRVALNGTTASWTLEVSESKVTTAAPTSGSVLSSAAGAAQQAIWIKAAYSTGNYTFTVYDWEYKTGNGGPYQNVTSTAFASNVKVAPLTFFEIYVYSQKLQTVVSIVNTTDASVIGSETIHPVLDGNLTKIGYLTDIVTMASGTDAAMILDSTYFVDHNAFASAPGAQGAFLPMAAGTLAAADAPFDPAAVQVANYTHGTDSSSTFSNVNASLSAFSTVLNSSNPASETSSALNASLVLNKTTSSTVAFANQSLTTLRAKPENVGVAASATLYLTSWSPVTIQTQISSFLTSYVSAKSGVPAADVEIQSYIISNVQVQSTFTSAAAKTIHDYLATAIPGMLAAHNLSLVNQTTGAVVAGADIGGFMNLATGAVVQGRTGVNGQVFDPVNGQWYGSAEAAGFPIGSGVSSSGAIFVPEQAAFLGWTAAGAPEFGPGACFIVCVGGLTGAASAVSSFFGGAASTVTNTLGTVSKAVTSDVIKPVSGSLGTDFSGFSSDVSKAASNVMPFFGGTLQNVGSSVTGTISKGLSSISGSIASTASGAAGAILSGTNSIGNTIWHLGGAAGSAIEGAAGSVVNTVGKAVSTAGAVLSPYFSSVANLPSTVYNAASGAVKSLASLGGSIASAGMSALDSVGHSITQAVGGAWSTVTNAFGSLGSNIVNGIKGVFSALNPFSWLSGLGGSVSTLIEIVIIVVVVVITLVAIVLLLRHRRHHGGGREVGGKKSGVHRGSKA